MNRAIVNSALIAAFTSIIGKMVYYLFLAPNEDFDMYTRFFYLLCFLAAIFMGLRSWKLKHTHVDFTADVKTGMKIVSIYALVVSIFTWIYYKLIHPEYFAERIQRAVTAAKETTPDNLTQVEDTASFIFNAFTHSTITLFGLMILGFFYTLIIALIFRWRPKAFGLN